VRLALAIHRYFPHGGLQRDCRGLLDELLRRGHDCRVYCMGWEGDAPPGAVLRVLPARGLSNHRRDRNFQRAVQANLGRDPVDGVIGFNRMPGLDVYFAGDACFAQRAAARGALYRRTPRARHYAASERAVFDPAAATRILLLNATQRDGYLRHYATPPQRLHLLPPGVAPDRRAPEGAARRRRALRAALDAAEGELLLLFVGSAFDTKGLDRAIAALAALCEAQPGLGARLLVVGANRRDTQVRPWRRLAKRLGVAGQVEFLGAREDIGELMLGADLLVHPARSEAGGVVLLEALASGLPVIASGACGYAPCIAEARGGKVLEEPFAQEELDRALLRAVDGVYRADCREGGLAWAGRTDLDALHRDAADCIEGWLGSG